MAPVLRRAAFDQLPKLKYAKTKLSPVKSITKAYKDRKDNTVLLIQVEDR